MLTAAAALGGGVYISFFGVPGAGPSHKAAAKPGPVATATDAPPVVLPPSDPRALRALTTEQAETFNAGIPLSTLPNPSARPFILSKAPNPAAVQDAARSLECLTAAIYYEAASESDDGQRAVAQVVLNRVRHPTFPHTVCGVVYEGHERRTGCQFSFTCDGSLARVPVPRLWAHAQAIAQQALNGHVYAPVGWATHYHTYQVAPYWATSLVKLAQVGAHIFYRWQGRWGEPRAFTAAYAGGEALGTDTLPLVTDPMEGPPSLISHLERPVLSNGPDNGVQELAPGQIQSRRQIGLADRPVLGALPDTPTAQASADAR